MEVKDHRLVRDALAGNNEAFADLVERYGRLVHGIILYKVRLVDEVEDLVQDVFCKAYQELPTLREPDKFAPWLARMANNRAQAWLRQRHTRQGHQQREDFARWGSDGATPEGVLEARETCGIVWETLDRLSPEYRQILLLYHFEGCAQQDIARFLDINLSTVKWRLLRARQSMKRKVEEVFYLEKRQTRLSARYLRERVSAALPLLALWQPVRPRWGGIEHLRYWFVRRLLPLAYASVLGILGSLIYEAGAQQPIAKEEAATKGPILVRLSGTESLGTEARPRRATALPALCSRCLARC
ncbi:MAG: RNA polymerase sigma-70 factor (ECF subfamily) [Candidatus Latescibacterota bacterium]|jgi:RNA polymerase sigma-70 factor (ECF subfamily)